MSHDDLVTAFMCVESCLRAKPAVLRTCTLRPLLVSCCLIARKLLSDTVFTVGWACDQLSDSFSGLDVELLAALELQVLLIIDWRFPMRGESYQVYADAIFNAAERESGIHVPTPLMINEDQHINSSSESASESD